MYGAPPVWQAAWWACSSQMSQHGESWHGALSPAEEALQKGLPYMTTALTKDCEGRAGSDCGLLELAFDVSN